METVENPRTGERVTFVAETPDLLVMDVEWTRPGHRAVEHLHPGMEERFAVVEGRAAWRLEDPMALLAEFGPEGRLPAAPG